MSLGFILSEFCVYFTNFDVVPRGSVEALNASMKGHPQPLPNLSSLMFKLKSGLGSQIGKSVIVLLCTFFLSPSRKINKQKINKQKRLILCYI